MERDPKFCKCGMLESECICEEEMMNLACIKWVNGVAERLVLCSDCYDEAKRDQDIDGYEIECDALSNLSCDACGIEEKK